MADIIYHKDKWLVTYVYDCQIITIIFVESMYKYDD